MDDPGVAGRPGPQALARPANKGIRNALDGRGKVFVSMDDKVLALARQLASSSAGVNQAIAALQVQTAQVQTGPAMQALAQMNHLNDSVLASTRGMLEMQAQVGSTASGVNSLITANQSFTRLVDQITLPGSAVAKALAADSAFRNLTVGFSLKFGDSVAASILKLDTSRMVAASLVAQQKMELLSRHQIGQLVRADGTFRRSMGAHVGRMTRSYSALMVSTNRQDTPISNLSLVTSFAPANYYRHLEALESITLQPNEAASSETVHASLEEATTSVDDLLMLFDPSLHPLLLGARQAVESRNHDSPRHVMTSLRELLTHVLHGLAPNEQVKLWSDDPAHFHDGRPTRRSRMLFICRNINTGPLVDFIRADVSAGLKLVDLLNNSTHAVESGLTAWQLRSIVCRVESLLSFLLSLPHE